MKHATVALFALLLLVTWPRRSAHASPGLQEAAPVSVFFLRHAETAASTRTNRDPELSIEGARRAEALGRLLSKAGVTHLFSSELRRTRDTLTPLAARLGLEVETLSAGDPARQLGLLRELEAGAVAVVAGHSNTIPGMLSAFGVEPSELVQHETYGGLLRHEAYDRLFLLTLPADEQRPARMIELRYGE